MDAIAAKLDLIETYIDQLQTLAHPEVLRTDIREQRFIAYTLQVAMQAAKEAAAEIAELAGRKDPRTGVQVFQGLARDGWIPEALVPRLRTVNRFRQTLIHKADAGADLVADAFKEVPGTLLDFVRAVRSGIQPLADVSSLGTALANLGFGRIDDGLILSSLHAIHGREGQPETLSETRSALRRAIAFLRGKAQVPHLSLLPSSGTLPVLAVFFHHHPAPSARTGQLLTRWIWRRAADAAHRGEEIPAEQEARAIVSGREDLSVQGLLSSVSSSRRAQTGDLVFDLASAQTRLHLAALAVLRPREIATGEELDIAALCEQPGGPASPLVPGSPCLASRILHPGEGDLRSELANTSDREILRSHLLSETSQAALQRGDLPAFLDSRDKDLRTYVTSFLQTRAVWDATDRDRPALSSLIVADE